MFLLQELRNHGTKKMLLGIKLITALHGNCQGQMVLQTRGLGAAVLWIWEQYIPNQCHFNCPGCRNKFENSIEILVSARMAITHVTCPNH